MRLAEPTQATGGAARAGIKYADRCVREGIDFEEFRSCAGASSVLRKRAKIKPEKTPND